MSDKLKWLGEMGVDEVIEDEPINRYEVKSQKKIEKAPKAVNETKTKVTTSPIQAAISTRGKANGCKDRSELKAAVETFKDISITKTATNTVFSDGNPESDIMMIGEAPGAEEDAQGIPFCGASGKMLDQMFSYIDVTREKNFYITNTLFWRPPGNRRPTPEELAICLPFVEKHIALIKPKLIILVGGTAIASILGSKEGITKIRGKFFDYNNDYLDAPIKTTAIFHPSYLLRSPGQKRLAWNDMLMLKKYISENGIKL